MKSSETMEHTYYRGLKALVSALVRSLGVLASLGWVLG